MTAPDSSPSPVPPPTPPPTPPSGLSPARTPVQPASIDLPIEGMHCASCVGRVEQALAQVAGVDSVAVNLATERATVRSTAAVDRAALVLAVQQAGYDVPAQTIELAIEGMHCASCVGRVEQALRAVPGVTAAAVNLATERATVHGRPDLDAVVAAIRAVGYQAQPLASTAQRAASSEKKTLNSPNSNST